MPDFSMRGTTQPFSSVVMVPAVWWVVVIPDGVAQLWAVWDTWVTRSFFPVTGVRGVVVAVLGGDGVVGGVIAEGAGDPRLQPTPRREWKPTGSEPAGRRAALSHCRGLGKKMRP